MITGPGRVRTRAAGAAVLGCVAVVLLLGLGVHLGFAPQLRFDSVVSRALYAGDDRSSTVSVLLEVLTTPGYSWFRAIVFVPVLVWLGVRRRWATLVWVAAATVLVSPLNEGLKQLVDRTRPDYAEGGSQLASLSFPSGHAAGIACLVTTALVLAWPRLRARRWWVLLGVLVVVLVGLSRVWLGVHFPTDVLAGWAVGVGWTLLVALLLGGLPGGRAALPAREASWTA